MIEAIIEKLKELFGFPKKPVYIPAKAVFSSGALLLLKRAIASMQR